MNKTSLLISNVALETGALLKQYLKDRGVYNRDSDAIVCYGARAQGPKALNHACARGKINRMISMEEGGVRLVPWFTAEAYQERGLELLKNFTFPLLARNIHGHGGTDIVPVFQPQEVEWRIAAGWEWFSSYVPVANEYRVFVYRDKVLDTYEKIMKRPTDYKYIGRNFRNGFDFVHVPNCDDASEMALKSLCGLDFAAVDMVRGLDGLIYILETNTAPGVLKSGAQKTLGKLADCIADWCQKGYPEA